MREDKIFRTLPLKSSRKRYKMRTCILKTITANAG